MSARGRVIVATLSAARRAVQLYPPTHPAFEKNLASFLEAVEVATDTGPFTLNLHQGRLYHDSSVLSEDAHGAASITEAFEARRIESMTFDPRFTRDDALGLLEVLGLKPSPDLDVQEQLESRGVTSARVAHLHDATEEARQERDRIRQQDRVLHRRLTSALRSISESVSRHGCADLGPTGSLVTELLQRLLDDQSAVLGLATIRDQSERMMHHSMSVMIYSMTLGRELGIPPEGLTSLGISALMHDIGKAAFDEDDPAQHEPMREMHPAVGAEILGGMPIDDPSPMLVAYEHHMLAGGRGWPERSAEYISHPYSRMVCIANRYDNLVSPGEGARALTPDQAIIQLLREAADSLDPILTRLFVKALGAFPIGCMVRLTDHSVGVICRSGEDPLAPVVRLLYAADGVRTDGTVDLDLSATELRIIEVVDPDSLAENVSEHL